MKFPLSNDIKMIVSELKQKQNIKKIPCVLKRLNCNISEHHTLPAYWKNVTVCYKMQTQIIIG